MCRRLNPVLFPAGFKYSVIHIILGNQYYGSPLNLSRNFVPNPA